MSCHDIGRGMNSVANVVLDLYESGQINKESASRLVLAFREGVNWCDGNESETVADVVERGYCGLCFEKKPDLTDIYDNDLKYPDSYKVFDAYDKSAAHFYLCPECRKKVLDEYMQKMNKG